MRNEQPVNHCTRWSVQDDEELAALVALGTPNAVIAEKLGRTLATINGRKNRRGLSAPRPTECVCGAPIEQAASGRPRRHCPACTELIGRRGQRPPVLPI